MSASTAARPFDALICDLDGVLVDSEPIHRTASQRLVAPHVLTDAEYERFIGSAREPFMAWLIERFTLTDAIPALAVRYDVLVQEELARGALPRLAGVDTLLDAAVACGLRLALCSQSIGIWVHATLGAAGLVGRFEVVVSAEAAARPKPAPDLYLHTATLLGINPARCLVIEDSIPGLQAARAAGATVVQTRGASLPAPPQPEAHLVLPSLAAFEAAWLDQGVPARV